MQNKLKIGTNVENTLTHEVGRILFLNDKYATVQHEDGLCEYTLQSILKIITKYKRKHEQKN